MLGEVKQQKESLKRVLIIFEDYCRKEHQEMAIILYNLAVAIRGLNLLSQAQEQASRAYNMFAKTYGTEHPNSLDVKELIKICQKSLDKSKAAASAVIFSYSAGNETEEPQKILLRRKTSKDECIPTFEVAF